MRPRASFHSKAALLFWNGKENAMNYIPKRVFLLDCGKYIELSYEEFCEKKEESEGFDAKNRRYILVQGMLLEVDEPAYREHYRICRRMRYLMEMEQKVQILSFEDCIEAGLEGSILSAENEKLPDAIAEGKDTIQRLHRTIDRLTNEERALVLAHFFFHATQEELARRCGITQAAVSQRLQRILRKLRRELESA